MSKKRIWTNGEVAILVLLGNLEAEVLVWQPRVHGVEDALI